MSATEQTVLSVYVEVDVQVVIVSEREIMTVKLTVVLGSLNLYIKRLEICYNYK